jgi:hypothetical protein
MSAHDATATAERIIDLAERDVAVFDGSVFVVNHNLHLKGDERVVDCVTVRTRNLYLPNTTDAVAYVGLEAVHDQSIVTR